MKILVVSGFLGAGKTTFIKELAKRTKKDFAVMENEFGAVGVDADFLEDGFSKGDKTLNIWEMTEGCICCSVKTDFATSVLTIANTVDPEYLIVEPTGVGMLSRIIENIRKIQYERIGIIKPVTILNGKMSSRYKEEFREIYEDQLKAAGTVLISKMENADSKELAALGEEISSINPKAEICLTHYTKQPQEWWDALLEQDEGIHALKGKESNVEEVSPLESIGLKEVGLGNENELLLFLQGIVAGVFGDICRAKGYMKTGTAWLRFDVVEHTYSITGIEEMPDSKAVFIGKNIRRALLREVLQRKLYTEEQFKRPRKSAHPMLKRSRI